MGTNYYAEDGTHVGKRYAAGGGKTGWIWAVEIGEMERHRRFRSTVEGTFGREEMTAVIAECAEQDFAHVGEEFS